MKITLTKYLLAFFVALFITVLMYSCNDDYNYINSTHNDNVGNGGGSSDSTGDGVDDGDPDSEDDGDIEEPVVPKDIFDDLKNASIQVHKEFEKAELAKIDTSIQHLKIKIYANKDRSDTLTTPIIIVTKDLFNDAYDAVNAWLENLHTAGSTTEDKTSFIVISGYRSPGLNYQYKISDDDTNWVDTTVVSYGALHTLATSYGKNIRYNFNNNGFISTTDDISKVINQLLMPNFKDWHMNGAGVRAVAMGSYATTSLIYSIGKSIHKDKVVRLSGFGPIMSFSQGGTDKANVVYKNIEKITGADANAKKAFSNLRLSEHFFKSYISNRADSATLDRYNLIKTFSKQSFNNQTMHFIIAEEDRGASVNSITGQPFLFRDIVSSDEWGASFLCDNVDYAAQNFGDAQGSYYNWPSDDTQMQNTLRDLIFLGTPKR
ncbi:MAG: hypothetical protein ACQPRJ_00580 [Solitalea-like symbiont of Acarus siro]